jgi:hypothetical protein
MEHFILGIEHIMDPRGYDHMLFLLALAAWATLHDTVRLLWLATAFTLGHTVTLILAGLEIIWPSSSWVEFLIPLTILAVALGNMRQSVFKAKRSKKRLPRGPYIATAGFGLIHGLGFSTFFRISRDPDESIVGALLQFNLGIEAGQLIILIAILAVTTVAQGLGVKPREQQLFICGGTSAVAVVMLLERFPF